MRRESKEKGWNDEQRKTLARGGEALKNVGKLTAAWLFGTARQAGEAQRAIVDGVEEKLGEFEQAELREEAITVGAEAVDEDLDDEVEAPEPLNRIECVDCQTFVGAISPTTTFDSRAIERFAREHAGHRLNRVRPRQRP